MKKILRKISEISARTFLYLFIASALVCVIALRHNNQQMVKLRDSVYAADKNNGDVNAALNNLRQYVFAHMNTNLSSGNNNIKPMPKPIANQSTRLFLEPRACRASKITSSTMALRMQTSISLPAYMNSILPVPVGRRIWPAGLCWRLLYFSWPLLLSSPLAGSDH
jgi:hypothetical protein